jgi:hypothetical protein
MKRLLAACAFTAMLAGCGTAPGSLDAPDSPVARSDWSDGAAMQALLEGTLELRDGCLVVTPAWESEPPDTFVVPVFPRKYASWDDAREVLTFGGVEYEMGDEIAAGGGWGPPSDDIDLPAACEPDASGDVMYVQDTSLAPMNERGY